MTVELYLSTIICHHEMFYIFNEFNAHKKWDKETEMEKQWFYQQVLIAWENV